MCGYYSERVLGHFLLFASQFPYITLHGIIIVLSFPFASFRFAALPCLELAWVGLSLVYFTLYCMLYHKVKVSILWRLQRTETLSFMDTFKASQVNSTITLREGLFFVFWKKKKKALRICHIAKLRKPDMFKLYRKMIVHTELLHCLLLLGNFINSTFTLWLLSACPFLCIGWIKTEGRKLTTEKNPCVTKHLTLSFTCLFPANLLRGLFINSQG